MSNSKNMSNLCKLKYHYVYQTKNTVNGKTYIGRHSTNNLLDGYVGSGKLLRRSINKYGKDKFICIILMFFDTYQESVDEEKWLVTKIYCEDKNNYNIVEGGSNPIMYGSNNPSWKGGISKDVNYRIKGAYCFKGENNPRFGYRYSTDEKTNMMLLQKCSSFYADGVYFNSLREFMKITKRSRDFAKLRIISDKYPRWYYSKKGTTI